jgi:hypothetical protein
VKAAQEGEPRKVQLAEMTPSSRSVFAVDFIYLEKGDFLGVLDFATVIEKGMGSEVLAMLALVSMRTTTTTSDPHHLPDGFAGVYNN